MGNRSIKPPSPPRLPKPVSQLIPSYLNGAKTSQTSSQKRPMTNSLPITPIDTYIQNLTTKGKSPEDVLQTLKICYEDDGEDVAAATTFPDNEDF